MAVEQVPPIFQPRLQPKPALPTLSPRDEGFAEALDSARAAPLSGHGSGEVHGEVQRPGENAPGASGRTLTGQHAATHLSAPSTAPPGVVWGAVEWPRQPVPPEKAATQDNAAAAGAASAASGASSSVPSSAQASPAGQSRDQAAAGAPARFSAEDEAALRAWASAVKPPPRAPRAAKPLPLDLPPSLAAADPSALALTAKAQLGRRYTVGGETPRQGFDCSGLTSYVYARSGVELSRNSREQFRQGQPVKREDLRPGDLVFFGKKGVHHVGIYMGEGTFVHAASSGGAVKTGSLDDPVWSSSYAGGRRILRDDAGMGPKGAGLSATG
ncbi:C40 family peptidase [Fundidesulfovibrio terrae]|uniref:C40 family peptidase n=1 Tax=Fundidesulfovibrio terrae TaxID=2922866 RepID=UPI001FAEF5AA|nr:C40 family peptidase [Fundidesulfovibrio terrae]